MCLGDLRALCLKSIVQAVDTERCILIDSQVHVNVNAAGDLSTDGLQAAVPRRVGCESHHITSHHTGGGWFRGFLLRSVPSLS